MEHPATVPSNTGDGQKMAMRAGAAMGNMREAWWVPVAALPGALQYGQQKVLLILRERSLPGTIMVNRKGKRFVNEAANYNALGAAFHHFDPVDFTHGNLPCWLICDRAVVNRYGFLDVPAAGAMPDWIPSAPTLKALANKVGIDQDGLHATIRRWNANVLADGDADFARGKSAYDGFNGDLSRYPGKEATLGLIKQPPFYALRIYNSTLGTSGGPRTDVNAAVLGYDGLPIPGLYAAGNAMAAPTGMVYGGAGGTLGPALVFGYLAGRHVAAQN